MVKIVPQVVLALGAAGFAAAADTCNSTDPITYSLSAAGTCATAGLAFQNTLTTLVTDLLTAIGTVQSETGGASTSDTCDASDPEAGLIFCNTTALSIACTTEYDEGDLIQDCLTNVGYIAGNYSGFCEMIKDDTFGSTIVSCAQAASGGSCYADALLQCKNATDPTTASNIVPVVTLVQALGGCNVTGLTGASTQAEICEVLFALPTTKSPTSAGSVATATLGSALLVAAAAMFA